MWYKCNFIPGVIFGGFYQPNITRIDCGGTIKCGKTIEKKICCVQFDVHILHHKSLSAHRVMHVVYEIFIFILFLGG